MFTVTGLDGRPFADLYGLDDAALRERNARRVIADAHPGYPCRVTLEDAAPGQSLLLLNHEHQPADTPFRARHAIFVREGATDAAVHVDVLPLQLRRRMLSLRGFDAAGMMTDAELVDGEAAVPVVGRLLSDPRTAYLHAHFAVRGCYAARIERA